MDNKCLIFILLILSKMWFLFPFYYTRNQKKSRLVYIGPFSHFSSSSLCSKGSWLGVVVLVVIRGGLKGCGSSQPFWKVGIMTCSNFNHLANFQNLHVYLHDPDDLSANFPVTSIQLTRSKPSASPSKSLPGASVWHSRGQA